MINHIKDNLDNKYNISRMSSKINSTNN